MKASFSILPPFLLLVVLAGLTAGFIQEIIFHEKLHGNGNQIIFRSNIPDTTAIAQLGPFSKICYRGLWQKYSATNYFNRIGEQGSASKTGNLTCYNGPLDFQSVRHHIASETGEAAISFYKNISWSGPEILVTADELSVIEMPVVYGMWSKASQWTVFEGQYFTGNSECLPITTGDNYMTWKTLTTVGSVVKTCDPVLIRLAMQKYHKVDV